jgi:hypothetical protein
MRVPIYVQQSLQYKPRLRLHSFTLGTYKLLLYGDVVRLIGAGGEIWQWPPPNTYYRLNISQLFIDLPFICFDNKSWSNSEKNIFH